MANRPQSVNTNASENWKEGDVVNIGTLKGLIVTGVKQEGTLQQFILKHPTTNKEYTFVPGGLRKTYEPPAQTANVDIMVTSKALDRAKSILNARCRRASDAPLRKELQEVVSLLSSSRVDRDATSVDQTAVEGLSPAVVVGPAGTAVADAKF